jgi:UDP-N-acetylmuramyl tripeptide synthase
MSTTPAKPKPPIAKLRANVEKAHLLGKHRRANLIAAVLAALAKGEG